MKRLLALYSMGQAASLSRLVGLYRRFEKCDLLVGQLEQRVDEAVDARLGLGNLRRQAMDLDAVAVDPVFPIGAFSQRNLGLEGLLDLGAEGGEVG